jgi:hypothetical protein
MNAVHRVALMVVAFSGAFAFASADQPSHVLNKLEVQRLVARDAPVADLALAAHFTAVAHRYRAEAARHRATADVFNANANRAATTNASSQSDRLAARAAEWAVRARELAAYHAARARGRQAVFPAGASALHGGQGAPEPSADQLRRLAVTARTRIDHLVLVEYYMGVARHKALEADTHLRMSTGYRAGIHKGGEDAAWNHERLASHARRAANLAREAAARHRVFANLA